MSATPNEKFIKTRKTFEGTTKSGQQRTVTLFLSQAEAQRLLQAAEQAAASPDGASLKLYIGQSKFNPNEANTAITLEASTPSARYQASSAPRAAGPAVAAAAPKFAFQPKAKIQAKA
jgi:hypothetical protein